MPEITDWIWGTEGRYKSGHKGKSTKKNLYQPPKGDGEHSSVYEFNFSTFHQPCCGPAELDPHLVELEHGQLGRPWGSAAEQLGGEGGVCDLHAFLQSPQESIAGRFQQSPHIDPLLRNNQSGRLLYLAKKETVQLWNVLGGFYPQQFNNKAPTYFARQIYTSVMKETD